MERMELYNAVRAVPKEAQTPFDTGKFKGTDINPMWRIKTLTEQFGACGVGWYYEITDKWIERIDGLKDLMCFVTINLYIKVDGEWSKPISGIGGSTIAKTTSKGFSINDEGYKMASTDAISVACKNLGIGADIYWDGDHDKYTAPENDVIEMPSSSKYNAASTSNSNESIDSDEDERKELRQRIIAYGKEHGMSAHEVAADYKLSDSSPLDELQRAWNDLTKEESGKMQESFEALKEDVPWK